MGTVVKQGIVTMQELPITSLAQTDSLSKLLIEKGLITQVELMQKLSAERGGVSGDVARDELSAQELTCIA